MPFDAASLPRNFDQKSAGKSDLLVLQSARDILKERGWAGGSLEKSNGRVCLVGALMKALDVKVLVCNDDDVDHYVRLLGFSSVPKAITWNDSLHWFPQRQVLHRFDAAMKKLHKERGLLKVYG
jgi:hypothetical protein